MRQIVLRGLREYDFLAKAVDNEACDPGTPDIYYFRKLAFNPGVTITGWIEAKRIDERDLPAYPSTPIRVRHYTPQQRLWHQEAAKAGLSVHVLIIVGTEWLLLPGAWAASHLGNVVLDVLRTGADTTWRGGFEPQKLIPCLLPPA